MIYLWLLTPSSMDAGAWLLLLLCLQYYLPVAVDSIIYGVSPDAGAWLLLLLCL